MSDRFEGTALLVRGSGEYGEHTDIGPDRAGEDVEYLHVLAVRANGDKKPRRMCIPVRPTGTPENPKRTTWEYTIDDDTINVSPSVKVTDHEDKETFHSAGQWAVKFERFTPSADIIWKDGIGDHGQRARFIELNPGDFSV